MLFADWSSNSIVMFLSSDMHYGVFINFITR